VIPHGIAQGRRAAHGSPYACDAGGVLLQAKEYFLPSNCRFGRAVRGGNIVEINSFLRILPSIHSKQ
jgi:hypothetical protein